jgi:hypothetical protein
MYDLQENHRDPIRTLPLILLAPKLLSSPMGHLLTAVPMLFSFLFLIAVITYKRTHSLLFSILSAGLILPLNGIYSPVLGFGDYWLDLPASFAMGSAALSLLQYGIKFDRRWLMLFGCFFSITATARFSAAFYLLTFAGVVLLLYFVQQLKDAYRSKSSIAKSALLLALTTAPGLAFLLTNILGVSSYYSTYGYAFNSTVFQSLSWTWLAVRYYFGTAVIGSLLLIWIAGGFLALKEKRTRTYFLLNAWLPISQIVFLCLIVKAVDGVHPVLYLVPALLVVASAGIKFDGTRAKKIACIVLILIEVAFGVVNFQTNMHLAKSPPPDAIVNKISDRQIAKCIVDNKIKSFAQFDVETLNPVLEAFFASDWCCHEQPFFSIHESYLKGANPGLSPVQVAELIYRKTMSEAQMIAIHHDAANIKLSTAINNEYSRTLAAYMTQHVPNNNHWTFVRAVNTAQGQIDIFKSLAAK